MYRNEGYGPIGQSLKISTIQHTTIQHKKPSMSLTEQPLVSYLSLPYLYGVGIFCRRTLTQHLAEHFCQHSLDTRALDKVPKHI